MALAVSGGADSVALLLLVAAWARRNDYPAAEISVLTVDHGLRPEAAAEAAMVAGWARARGHPAITLCRQGAPITRNVQANARAARRTLLAAWCRENGVRDLVLAHHQDDQAETVLLRLARGSGIDGLSAMTDCAGIGAAGSGPRLLRPLLGFPKARLIATLRAAGQAWIEDPSNADPRYARARLRRLMPDLAREGLGAARLAATARRMARARAALDFYTDALAARAVRFDPGGFCAIDAAILRDAPEEIALRLVLGVLGAVGAGAYKPRQERTEQLYYAIRDGNLGGGRTLGGCRIAPAADGAVLVAREPAVMAPPLALAPGDRAVWDRRFAVALGDACPPGTVRGLGVRGWRLAAGHSGVPAAARPGLPSLWAGETLLAVPAIGFAQADFPADGFRADFLFGAAPRYFAVKRGG